MKNYLIGFVCLFVFTFMSCQKDGNLLQPDVVSLEMKVTPGRTGCMDCLCKAPNGVTLPCSELDNWVEYSYGSATDGVDFRAEAGWKYITKDCPKDENGNPQIKCEKKRNGDCKEAFDCTLCDNCPAE